MKRITVTMVNDLYFDDDMSEKAILRHVIEVMSPHEIMDGAKWRISQDSDLEQREITASEVAARWRRR